MAPVPEGIFKQVVEDFFRERIRINLNRWNIPYNFHPVMNEVGDRMIDYSANTLPDGIVFSDLLVLS